MEAELVHDQLPAAPDLDTAEITDPTEIPEAELVETDDQAVATDDHAAAVEQGAAGEASRDQLAPADLREVAADEDRVLEADSARVPSADEIAEGVRRAQRALIELRQREQADTDRAADEAAGRDEELTRWHHDDTHTHTHTDTAAAATHSGPALDLSDD